MTRLRFETTACTTGETLRDPENGQLMHSSIGPVEEARLIYLEPSRIEARLQELNDRPLVLWDIGMGIAANSLLAWQLAHSSGARRVLEIHSFEKFPEGLGQVLDSQEGFSFLRSHEDTLRELLSERKVCTHSASVEHRWFLHTGDFSEQLAREDSLPPAPDLIFYDFYSPKVCPELWSLEMFRLLHSRAPSARLYTYSAATPVRVALLLAGFTVGRHLNDGRATPIKAENTVAVSRPELAGEIPELLDAKWLDKLARSSQFRPYGRTAWSSNETSVEAIIREISQAHPFTVIKSSRVE